MKIDPQVLLDQLNEEQLHTMHERYPLAREELLEHVEGARALAAHYGPVVGSALAGVHHMMATAKFTASREVMAGMLGIALVEIAQLTDEKGTTNAV